MDTMETTATKTIRIVLGVFMLLTGLNKFLHFLPTPEGTPDFRQFMSAMVESGYFLRLVGIVEITVGAALLARKFVPLALVVLAPITVNIVMIHLMLDMGGLLPALILAGLHVALATRYWDRFVPLLEP